MLFLYKTFQKNMAISGDDSGDITLIIKNIFYNLHNKLNK